MFARLPESNAKRQRRTGGFVVSTVCHAALIALAVRATGLTAAPSPTPTIVTPLYLAPKAPPPTPPAPTPRRLLSDPAMPVAPRETEILRVVTPDIPTTIPEPGVMQGLLENAFDAPRVSTVGRPTGAPNVADGSPLPENMVEKAVVAIPGTATPRYPAMLQSAGVEGSVRAQFVVDTLGRVEQGSFRSLEATHDLFAAAVRDALGRARFKPAEVAGRTVRQLVEQTFSFTISR